MELLEAETGAFLTRPYRRRTSSTRKRKPLNSQFRTGPDARSTAKMNQLKRAIAEDEQALKSANKGTKQLVRRQAGSNGDRQTVREDWQEDSRKSVKKISPSRAGLTTHVTAPIVAVGGASLAAFNEVDKGYDIVIQKTVRLAHQRKGCTTFVDQLATSIPTDFETAGNAVGEGQYKVWLTGDALYDLSEQFIQFAKLNNTDVTSSVDSVQKALCVWA